MGQVIDLKTKETITRNNETECKDCPYKQLANERRLRLKTYIQAMDKMCIGCQEEHPQPSSHCGETNCPLFDHLNVYAPQ